MKYIKEYNTFNGSLFMEIPDHDYHNTQSVTMKQSTIDKLLDILKDYNPKLNSGLPNCICYYPHHNDSEKRGLEYIYEIDDDYFLVSFGDNKYKCDSIDGIIELLKIENGWIE